MKAMALVPVTLSTELHLPAPIAEGAGIGELGRVQSMHVAAYIERLQGERSASTVKQHLACIRMLFDWLVTGHVMPSNPAHSVRGPRRSVRKAQRRFFLPRKQPRCLPAWTRIVKRAATMSSSAIISSRVH